MRTYLRISLHAQSRRQTADSYVTADHSAHLESKSLRSWSPAIGSSQVAPSWSDFCHFVSRPCNLVRTSPATSDVNPVGFHSTALTRRARLASVVNQLLRARYNAYSNAWATDSVESAARTASRTSSSPH